MERLDPMPRAELRNGRIEIHGDAGDRSVGEMRGGRIHVHGSAGNRAGTAYPGSLRRHGGGTILVDGNAGDELGPPCGEGSSLSAEIAAISRPPPARGHNHVVRLRSASTQQPDSNAAQL